MSNKDEGERISVAVEAIDEAVAKLVDQIGSLRIAREILLGGCGASLAWQAPPATRDHPRAGSQSSATSADPPPPQPGVLAGDHAPVVAGHLEQHRLTMTPPSGKRG